MSLSVRAFYDGNNDGMANFAGLIAKLIEYLEWLGVDCICSCRSSRARCATAATTSPITGRARRYGDVEDVPGARPRRHTTRYPGDHGPGHQPYQRPAPWFKDARSAPTAIP